MGGRKSAMSPSIRVSLAVAGRRKDEDQDGVGLAAPKCPNTVNCSMIKIAWTALLNGSLLWRWAIQKCPLRF